MRVLSSSDMPALEELPRALLESMRDAGARIAACERAFAEAGSNAVAEVLHPAQEFFQWDHYPKGDVYCPQSHAQYYYHAHPPEVRANVWGDEHGHFHTFLRPPGLTPQAAGDAQAPSLQDPPTHLVAISMGYDGRPARLFTTNKWVTGETWQDAKTVCGSLGTFDIGHDNPSQTANTWISCMLTLFRPTIEALLHARDEVLSMHSPASDVHVFEDRDLEVASIADIDLDRQLAAVNSAAAR